MIDLTDEAVQAFIEESREHLVALEQGLLALEGGAGTPDAAAINTIFRAAHTIKGGAGFFALAPVQRLSHAMENVLGKLRTGDVDCTPEVVTALLEATSVLGAMIADLEHVDAVEHAAVLARVERAADERPALAAIPPLPISPTPAAGLQAVAARMIELPAPDGTPGFRIAPSLVAQAQHREHGGRYLHVVDLEERSLPTLEQVAAIIDQHPTSPGRIQVACATVLHAQELCDLLGIDPTHVRTASDALLATPDSPPPRALRPAADVIRVPPLPPIPIPAHSDHGPPTRIAASATMAPPATSSPVSMRPHAEGAGSIRVHVAQLDRLMTLAGELVLTRNALLKKASERDLDEMIELTARVDAITSDLQDGIMATRMQPVGIVFTKFRRIVRDLAMTLGKRIDLEIDGEEVELDKTIIEAIGDPLTHLVRNSADHGLEAPPARAAAGKPDRGKISLRAYHEAGQVVIEVADDGRGIDPDRIARKAEEQRLRTREQIEALSDDEKVRLIFEPGFSTAAQVTEVSGRGVGMDVVASSITKVGGSVDIRSAVGQGTTMVVRLPLTLAIIPSILVATGNERFAIPQVNLVELVRIPARDVPKRVERVGSASVMRLRGELLPLLELSRALAPRGAERRLTLADRRAADQGPPPEQGERRRGEDRRTAPVNVAVVASGNLRYGLVVDQLLDSEEIVVKPLGVHLRGCREYAGATILGDGTVAVILDVQGLGASADLAATKAMIDNVEAKRRAQAAAGDTHSYLVFENAADERFAIPLGLVSRIERRPEQAIVRAGGRETVTLGGGQLALVAIEAVAKVGARARAPHFHAIVCRAWGREVGLMASRIVDVIEAGAEIDPATHVQPGILGSMVVEGQVLLLVDVHGLVDAVLPEYRKRPPAVAAAEEAPLLLVVEDSPFFRKQIVTCLHDAGYRTVAAEDGQEGLALFEQHPDVSLVVSDIEMPKMDGLEMTRRIRAGGHRDVPIFAVTTVSGEAAERRGREAGISEYMIKLDREQLVERTNHYLRSAKPKRIEGPGQMTKGAF